MIAPLAKQHNRAGFTCGEAALDAWFQTRASQDERRDIARVFVALDDDERIAGFYSLSAFTLELDTMPAEIAVKLPRYDLIPAALIGRLARDQSYRGKAVGEFLLADAIRRILTAASELAVFAIVVEAKNEAAATFYQSFGFRIFPLHPERLFLLTSTAAKALDQAKAS